MDMALAPERQGSIFLKALGLVEKVERDGMLPLPALAVVER